MKKILKLLKKLQEGKPFYYVVQMNTDNEVCLIKTSGAKKESTPFPTKDYLLKWLKEKAKLTPIEIIENRINLLQKDKECEDYKNSKYYRAIDNLQWVLDEIKENQ